MPNRVAGTSALLMADILQLANHFRSNSANGKPGWFIGRRGVQAKGEEREGACACACVRVRFDRRQYA